MTTQPDHDALLLALCEKHEELREPCQSGDHSDHDYRGACPGYIPKTGPALLAGLLEVCGALNWPVEFYPSGSVAVKTPRQTFIESSFALALARAEGLTGGA